MRQIRLLAIGTLVAIGGYFAFRSIVARCAGAACDAYIPVSLLIPALILVMVAVTGVTATTKARPSTTWFAALLASTALGVLGPIFALVIFRDSPDVLVPVATLLEVIAAATALGYSITPQSGVEAEKNEIADRIG